MMESSRPTRAEEDILDGRDVPVTLEMGIRNMAVIEAVFRSAKQGAWVTVER